MTGHGLRLAVLVLAILVRLLAADAQQVGKVYRIGWLQPAQLRPFHCVDGFLGGLRDAGYVEGRNVVIEYRWGDGRFDRLPELAAELVGLKVDVIVSTNTTALQVAKRATTTTPIVMMGPNDPVATGIVGGLARPGGNVTGLSQMVPQLSGKRLELLREMVPGLSRVVVLSNPANPGVMLGLEETEVAARALGVSLQSINVREPRELKGALSAIARSHPDALVLLADSIQHSLRAQIADFAARQRLPTISPLKEFAEAGGLMAYGVNYADLCRRAAIYVDKILRGTKPADLPIEQPTKFELVINLKAAKALGLTIPQSLLLRADEVIK